MNFSWKRDFSRPDIVVDVNAEGRSQSSESELGRLSSWDGVGFEDGLIDSSTSTDGRPSLLLQLPTTRPSVRVALAPCCCCATDCTVVSAVPPACGEWSGRASSLSSLT